MKRTAIFLAAAVLALGLAGIFVANSYGFLWFGKDNQKVEKVTLTVQGMTCEGCSSTIAAALQKVDGVRCAKVDHTTGLAQVCYVSKKTNKDALSAAVVQAGYTVSGAEMGECAHPAGDDAACNHAEGAKAEGAACCAMGGTNQVSSEAGASGGCPMMKDASMKDASAPAGSGCTRAMSGEAASGCPHAGAKATSTDGKEADAGCKHAAGASQSAVKGQKS